MVRRDRSAYLDALRAVALVRVVLFHATGWWWLTAFTAMPLMFFIAGTLFARSLERRPALPVVRDRYRRILLPYWTYLAAMVALWGVLGLLGEITPAQWVGLLLPVLSTDGVAGPGAGTVVHLTWFALWYLQMHLLLSALGPALRRAQRSHPAVLWTVIVALGALTAPVAPALTIAVFYGACWVVGYHHADGSLDAWLVRRWRTTALTCGPVGLALFVGLHDRLPPAAAVGVVLLGAFWLSLALGLQPRIEPALAGHRTSAVVRWFSRRSLTVYLWHGAVLYAVVAAPLPGGGTVAGNVLWCLVLLPVAALAVGWVEDVAARRRPQLWPHTMHVLDLRVPAQQRDAAPGQDPPASRLSPRAPARRGSQGPPPGGPRGGR